MDFFANLLPPGAADSRPSYRYQEIYEMIKQNIINGMLTEDNRLPSIRKLAEFLSLSATPVELAYQQLIAEGFIESRPRRGYYVTKLPEAYGKLGRPAVLPGEKTVPPASAAQAEPEKILGEIRYDFHLSKNDFTLFPFSIWKRLHHQLFGPEHRDLMFYGDAQGELGLRREIAGYLRQFRGVICDPGRIIVAAEQQMLVQYLALLFKNHTDGLAAEDPGYRLIPATFHALGYRIDPIALDDAGLRPDLLRQSSARLVSVSPSHQFPLGITMPVGRRLELLEWAKAVDGYILEDDYGGEFRYQGRPIPSLQGLVANNHVIYLGGFSQVLAPDFCIHYMVLPEHLVARYHDLRRNLMFEASASRIHQRVLEQFIQGGYFERHVRRMRNLYRKKNVLLTASIQKHFGGRAAILGDGAGLHLVLEIRSRLSEAELLRLAGEAGVRVASAAFFWHKKTETDQKRFMVGFGGIPAELIDEGIQRLHEAWSAYLIEPGGSEIQRANRI
ncbi:PLP-dependent aminotransferase family protein [Paenibacillus sp. alder61]|uniref:MocR-like pyridoxine biosynthesis transcription factor PdxR n=1 Tax=Paenibacillus sp. alder61 TaxID=2862948 RepID=UPI001CD42445|nr:PLP-dependent aminotransferase family protein [Paenibacillus sp. alder61]MCA1293431.1 PLP-dependent aminotransferase family protein [Paenibacillus sp. alder61]